MEHLGPTNGGTIEATRRGSPPAGAPTRIEPAVFRKAVEDHLLYTCIKEPSEATAYDCYTALAHTVRDRLVQRWLSTQKLYLERDAKRVYYLSSEFLTGRSLGLCLLNLSLYDEAEKLLVEKGYQLGQMLESGTTQASATAASVAWRLASWTRWRRWSYPRSAAAFATSTA